MKAHTAHKYGSNKSDHATLHIIGNIRRKELLQSSSNPNGFHYPRWLHTWKEKLPSCAGISPGAQNNISDCVCQFQPSFIRTIWSKRNNFSIPNRCYTSGRLTVLCLKYTNFIKPVYICLQNTRTFLLWDKTEAWKINTRDHVRQMRDRFEKHLVWVWLMDSLSLSVSIALLSFQ